MTVSSKHCVVVCFEWRYGVPVLPTTTTTTTTTTTMMMMMMMMVVTLFMSILHPTVSASPAERYTLPSFLDTPVNVTAYRGTDVDLPCAVRNLGPKHVVWKKINTSHPLTVADYVYDPDKSYEVVRPEVQGTPHWNLRISDVQMRHAGRYECSISTQEHVARNVTLTVIDAISPHSPSHRSYDPTVTPKEKAGIQLEGSQFVEKGRPLVLNCTAMTFTYRPKGVDWFKDGSKVKSDSHVTITEHSDDGNVLHSTLEVLRANMSDAGTYVCRSSKLNVASKRVIVLNTGSKITIRESEGDSHGVSQGGPHGRHVSNQSPDSSSGGSSSLNPYSSSSSYLFSSSSSFHLILILLQLLLSLLQPLWPWLVVTTLLVTPC